MGLNKTWGYSMDCSKEDLVKGYFLSTDTVFQ